MRSVGHLGLIRPGSTPCLATASRMAARSTMAGIPLLRETRGIEKKINLPSELHSKYEEPKAASYSHNLQMDQLVMTKKDYDATYQTR